MQFVAESREKVAALHVAQADDPALLYLPGRQGAQKELELAPAALLLVPARQGVHCVALDCELK